MPVTPNFPLQPLFISSEALLILPILFFVRFSLKSIHYADPGTVIHLYIFFSPEKSRGSFPGYKNTTIENRRYPPPKKKKCSGLKWDLEVLYLTQSPESRQAARVQKISKEFLCRESSAVPGTGIRPTCVVVMDLGLHITHFQVWYLYPHWLSRIE